MIIGLTFKGHYYRRYVGIHSTHSLIPTYYDNFLSTHKV